MATRKHVMMNDVPDNFDDAQIQAEKQIPVKYNQILNQTLYGATGACDESGKGEVSKLKGEVTLKEKHHQGM